MLPLSILLQLPDELLEQVARSCTTNTKDPEPHFHAPPPLDHATIAALARTCRHLHRIATAVLYSQLNIALSAQEDEAQSAKAFTEDNGDPDWATRTPPLLLLHRTLEANPSLASHVRELYLRDHDPEDTLKSWPDRHYETLLDVMSCLADCPIRAVHVSFLDTGSEEALKLLLDSVEGFLPAELDTLVLNNVAGTASDTDERGKLTEFGNSIGLLSRITGLRRLCLHGVALVAWVDEGNGLYTDRLAEWFEARKGTQSFTTLCIDNFVTTARILRGLIEWPAHLTHLSLNRVANKVFEPIELCALQSLVPMFEMHSATLRSISLGQPRAANCFRLMLSSDVAPMADMDPKHPLLRELELEQFGGLRKLSISTVMLKASFPAAVLDATTDEVTLSDV